MIFRFFSVARQCREVILIDFVPDGWHIRHQQQAELVDKQCRPAFQRWVEENGCVFPSGLGNAFEELWLAMHNGHLTEEESQARLNRFSEWMGLFNK